jgi:hypothetical protein
MPNALPLLLIANFPQDFGGERERIAGVIQMLLQRLDPLFALFF